MEQNKHANFDDGPISNNDLFNWKATIRGPKGTPYESRLFNLKIKFPKDYPFKPPSIIFVTKIFHPNICLNGEVCCHDFSYLKDDWTPKINIYQLLDKIYDLLEHPIFSNHGCGPKIKNFEDFYKKAREWAEKYGEVDDSDRKDTSIKDIKNNKIQENKDEFNTLNKEINKSINYCENELNKLDKFINEKKRIIKEEKKNHRIKRKIKK